MIAVWLAAGLLARQAVGATVRRGDDAGARERFWRAKAEEWLEDQLEAIQEAANRPQRARKRLATRITGDVPEFVSELPDMAPRVDALAVLADLLTVQTPDYSWLAERVAREMELIATWRRQERRRRDMDALLVLAA